MGREKLLNIEPQELPFRFELRKQAYCIVRLSNNSREHVAFKVMTTSPEKYYARPSIGILLPGSSCDVKVTMHGPKEAPSNMQCKDKFLIKSVVASPGDTVENSRKLFNEEGHVVEGCKLRVVYVFPSRQQSSDFGRSGEGSSLSGSIVQERSLNDTEQQDRNGWHVGDFLMKGITVVFLCLIFWYLIMQLLPLIWSLTFMIIMFVIKMTKRLVSDSVEDWIGKTLLYLCIHFFSVLFRRKENRPDNESRVSNAR